jgi:hypothetical protein
VIGLLKPSLPGCWPLISSSRNSLGALTLGKRPLNRRPFLPQRLPIIVNHHQHIALYGVVAERDKPVVTGPTGTAA